MPKGNHARYVDRRLSVARQLIVGISSEDMTGMESMLNTASLESALLQTYFALRHYFNELLDAYHVKPLEFDQWEIADQFFQRYEKISELREFFTLKNQAGSWLCQLLDHPKTMLQQAMEEDLASAKTSYSVSSKMIATSSPEGGRVSISHVTWVISEFSAIVERQREHLLEY